MSTSGEIRSKAAEIRVERLTKRFGEHRAVHEVSLRVRKGDFYTLLGPSGCGKTTLLRMIAGFETPDDGDIWFDDQRVNDVPPWQRDVGMVFQNFALWPHLSVFDNIAFGLRERRRPRSEIRDLVGAALQLVDLEGLGGRRPSQLSGGQQQRVALARTLVVEPRGLLLDEPLSSLDAKLRIQMRNELVRLQQEIGITTIYVTHDQEEALALSTRVAVFSHGVKIQEGTPQDIYESPHDRAVADFVGTSNFLEATVERIDGDLALLHSVDTGTLKVAWKTSLLESPGVSEKLLVHIRPESLRITAPDEPEPAPALRGSVRASTYLGSVLQYDIETDAGTHLKVNIVNPRRSQPISAGSTVRLTLEEQDAVLLRATPQQG